MFSLQYFHGAFPNNHAGMVLPAGTRGMIDPSAATANYAR
jgi:hypothetical protein